jgi:predicted site-specific integrase-resolvase
MDRARFCALVGITQNVLAVWVREGRVKTVDMGKRQLIDLRQWWLK